MKLTGKITKRDDDQRLVFGWASVAADENGNEIVDTDGDVLSMSSLEKAAYAFVLQNGEVREMHGDYPVAALVESIVFTPEKLNALGLSENSLPQGWFVGFKVFDDNTWVKIKTGDYKMFSIGAKVIKETDINEEFENS